MRRPRHIDLVYVEWEDATTRNKWMHPGEVLKFERQRFMIRQCGWLLRETRRNIVLASCWAPENEFTLDQFAATTRIPKTWMRARRRLARFVIIAGRAGGKAGGARSRGLASRRRSAAGGRKQT